MESELQSVKNMFLRSKEKLYFELNNASILVPYESAVL